MPVSPRLKHWAREDPMIDKAASLVEFFSILRRIPDLRLARQAHKYRLGIHGELRPQDGALFSEALGVPLTPGIHDFVFSEMNNAARLVRHGVGAFSVEPNGQLMFRTEGGIIVNPQTTEELFVLDEIFLERLYDASVEGEWFAWDVGMNVGIATLFFAGVRGWDVASYEPCHPVYEAALANLALNPSLQPKVEPVCAGIGGRTETVEITFDATARASNGLFGNFSKMRTGEGVPLAIEILDAAEVLTEIRQKAAGRRIYAKIDCEGAEYAMVDRLEQTGLLSALDVIVMEYHRFAPDQDPQRLADALARSGFCVFVQNVADPRIGELRAVRFPAS